MSASGQKQTYAVHNGMSALHPIATAKADIRASSCPLYPRKRTCAAHYVMSALGQKRTFRDLLDHLVNVWNTRTVTVAKCFKRFVKLGLKERGANRRACSELKHDGYRLQIHVRDGATFTARQRP
jgi:hypothetical protein